jgi:16S rRNA (guanine527-N7)-methyltransferase
MAVEMQTWPTARAWSARIHQVLAELDPSSSLGVDQRVTEKLCALLDLVVTWNARTDLTAARTADELVDLFVADAAALAEAAPRDGTASWIDVGSGAGAPGLPLALLRPDLELTLLEPKQKRVAFLRTAIGQLECLRTAVQRGRSQSLAAQSFDIAVSRATLPPAEWLAEGSRLARRGVWLLLAKAEPPELPGFRIERDKTYRWPLSGSERRAVCFVRS